MLWAEKYRPKKYPAFAGNGKAMTALDIWFSEWKFDGRPGALLYGPPGIGKTTAAYLAARKHDYEPIELNASDVRTKGALEKFLGGISGNHTIGKRKCVLMEEIDGMAGGDNGATTIVQIIRKAGVPVVCTCNDKRVSNLRGVLPVCLEIEFVKIPIEFMVPRLEKAVKKEGIVVEPEVLTTIARHAKGDLRQALTRMQFLAAGGEIKLADVYRTSSTMALDDDETLFEAADKIFEEGDFDKRLDSAFDNRLLHHMVFHSYPMAETDLGKLAQAASYFVMGDRIATGIQEEQIWSMAPHMHAMQTVAPASVVRKPRARVPKTLNGPPPRKFQPTLKNTLPVADHDMIDVFRTYAINAVDENSEIPDVVKKFQEYGLTFDDFVYVFEKKIPGRIAAKIKKAFEPVGPRKKRKTK